ncbi:hypothetical protein ACWD4P_18450 [Kitasatospora sp. NPDC002543]
MTPLDRALAGSLPPPTVARAPLPAAVTASHHRRHRAATATATAVPLPRAV